MRAPFADEPVSRILSRTAIPLGAPLLACSSDLPGGFRSAAALAAPDSPRWRAGPARTRSRSGRAAKFPPYLVLLRVGFTMPPPLPSERCALTAPFHPYPRSVRNAGGIFSVALAVSRPSRRDPGRYPAHCPAEFGLSSPRNGDHRSPALAAAARPACSPYDNSLPKLTL